MARRNVKYNGKWACFCTISDSFITELMTESEYDKWRMDEYGRHKYRSLDELNTASMPDIISDIRMRHTHDETIARLMECSIGKLESESMLYAIESKKYYPSLDDKGAYVCPNCGKEVKLGQIACSNSTCEIKFVWRKTEILNR